MPPAHAGGLDKFCVLDYYYYASYKPYVSVDISVFTIIVSTIAYES